MKRSGSLFSRIVLNLLLSSRLRSQSEGGYIIVVVAGMIVAISAMLLTAELVARVDSNSTKSSGNSAAGFYAAEAGLNLRARAIRAKFQGYNVPTGTSPDTTDPSRPPCTTGNIGLDDFACDSSLTIQNYLYPNDTTKRIPVSTYVIDQNPVVNGVKQPITVNIADEPFKGLSAQEYRYDVSSVAYDKADQATRQPTAFLGIRFKSRLVPLFQFAAFYQNDLDFYRPAPMTINGPIHTNGDLYLNAGGDLTLNGQLTSAGKMYRGVKNTNETCNANSNSFSGTVKILNPLLNSLLSMNCNGSLKGEITQSDSTNLKKIYVGGTYSNNWDGAIRPSIASLTVPPASLVDAKLPDPANNQNYDYWNKADLRIALRLTNDSAESPVSIDVVNADAAQSTNAAATNTLNSTCLNTSTTLIVGANNTSSGTSYTSTANPTENSTVITVADGSIFSANDALKITRSSDSINDFDENVILSKNGNKLTLARPLGKQAINIASGTVTVQKAIVWSSKTFFNYREKTLDTTTSTLAQQGRLIRMLNVDMQGLMNCASALMGKNLDDGTEGGLVWHFTVLGPKSNVDVTKTTPDNPNSYGVRVYNGATLGSSNAGDPPIKGLTVASDQAMYIRGDYNSNNKKPAAILADSINVLSNSSPLNDSYTCNSTGYDANYNASDCTSTATTTNTTTLANRPASSTTINAAFLAGVDITVGTQDSGGLNNYPRLHENWSNGSTLTYRGSMVSLGQARRVNGKFGAVGDTWNIYFAPNRNWDFDTDFKNAANLPPLSPRFVYLRQERFSRDYTRTSSLPGSFPLASIFPSNLISALPTMRFLF
jgi:hypothetical protein